MTKLPRQIVRRVLTILGKLDLIEKHSINIRARTKISVAEIEQNIQN